MKGPKEITTFDRSVCFSDVSHIAAWKLTDSRCLTAAINEFLCLIISEFARIHFICCEKVIALACRIRTICLSYKCPCKPESFCILG